MEAQVVQDRSRLGTHHEAVLPAAARATMPRLRAAVRAHRRGGRQPTRQRGAGLLHVHEPDARADVRQEGQVRDVERRRRHLGRQRRLLLRRRRAPGDQPVHRGGLCTLRRRPLPLQQDAGPGGGVVVVVATDGRLVVGPRPVSRVVAAGGEGVLRAADGPRSALRRVLLDGARQLPGAVLVPAAVVKCGDVLQDHRDIRHQARCFREFAARSAVRYVDEARWLQTRVFPT